MNGTDLKWLAWIDEELEFLDRLQDAREALRARRYFPEEIARLDDANVDGSYVALGVLRDKVKKR